MHHENKMKDLQDLERAKQESEQRNLFQGKKASRINNVYNNMIGSPFYTQDGSQKTDYVSDWLLFVDMFFSIAPLPGRASSSETPTAGLLQATGPCYQP